MFYHDWVIYDIMIFYPFVVLAIFLLIFRGMWNIYCTIYFIEEKTEEKGKHSHKVLILLKIEFAGVITYDLAECNRFTYNNYFFHRFYLLASDRDLRWCYRWASMWPVWDQHSDSLVDSIHLWYQQLIKMKILTWNINGIRASKIKLSELFDSLDADVICLQETKVTS